MNVVSTIRGLEEEDVRLGGGRFGVRTASGDQHPQ
jgi:hypothetical protein